MKSKFFRIFSFLVVLAMLIMPFSAEAQKPGGDLVIEAATAEAVSVPETTGKVINEDKNAIGTARYIVHLKDPAVAAYEGGIAGFSSTATQGKKLDVSDPTVQAYASYLAAQQDSFLLTLEQGFAHPIETTYKMQYALNAVVVTLTPAEAARVATMQNVSMVEREKVYAVDTDAGPTWIGAPSVWEGTLTTRAFVSDLTGDKESTPNASTRFGKGTFDYDFDTSTLSWEVWHNIPLDEVVSAHIHHAEAGVDGPVIIDLTTAALADSSFTGSAVLTEEQQGWLVNGALYINIHTETYATGEIRDQINQLGTLGEGIVAGIIDSGINSDHPSFADVGGDGFDHTNPYSGYQGVCDPADPGYDPTFVCNDKLVGAYEFVYPLTVGNPDQFDYPSPEDEGGHGSHTASTVTGNFTIAGISPAYTNTISLGAEHISGVAPHANVIAYDVCYLSLSTGNGLCPSTASAAAANQAIINGVDVINFSIGGGVDPYNDSVELAFLNAVGAGVFVSTSAGNSGPDAATLGHQSPWVSTTAASTHDRIFSFEPNLVDMTGGDTTPPADMHGEMITGAYGPAPIVYAGAIDTANAMCTAAFPAGTFTQGEIVVCDRGSNAYVDKIDNVKAGGGGGVVVANWSGSLNTMNAYTTAGSLPAIHIDMANGDVLRTWLATGTGHMASITESEVWRYQDPSFADVTADFSSRGPNTTLDVLKPSTAAPGVSILAAVQSQDPGVPSLPEFEFYQGTSMASPHNAGAAALLRSLHPNWSVMEIMSALMTTGNQNMVKEDYATPADPFDIGSGRVDLALAQKAGLVLDETKANFLAADPGTGGDPKTLNIASMYDDNCMVECSFTRVVSSTMGTTTNWDATFTGDMAGNATVSPETFKLAPYGSQELTITFNAEGLDEDWQFGDLVLSPSYKIFLPMIFRGAGTMAAAAVGTSDVTLTPQIPEAHLSMAILPSSGVIPEEVIINTRHNGGSMELSDLRAREITELTFEYAGLTKAEQYTEALAEDPSNDDPFDNYNDGTVYVVTTTVPVDAVRLVAEIVDSTSADIDIFMGFDANGDGLPQESELVAQSATGAVFEYIDYWYPDPGDYWILVQNWTSSVPGGSDPTTLAFGAVAVDEANFWLEGPTAVPQNTLFDLTLWWDEPTMAAGDVFYGWFSLGSDATNAGDIGEVPVNLYRHADALTKEASPTTVDVIGDTVVYTLTVQPNVTGLPFSYTITDTIPAGMTYVADSATASAGVVAVVGNELTWTGEMVAEPSYAMVTSDEDPACVMPYANSGAYANFQPYGLLPNAGVSGDTVLYTSFTTGDPFEFYGQPRSGGISFTDDGHAFFGGAANWSSAPWTNQDIPSTNVPNDLLAVFWNDWEIVYDAGLVRGVTLVNLTSGGIPVANIIEYDDIQAYGDPSSTLDFEILMWRHASSAPGDYEIVFAYDNLNGTFDTGTIGVENALGTAGTKFAYNDAALGTITDGMAICFDQILPEGVVITYEATANAVGSHTNTAEILSDNPGDPGSSASATVDVIHAHEVTLVYHDAEDVMESGESVYAAGDFNAWTKDGLAFLANADNSVFTATTYVDADSFNFKFTTSDADNAGWDMLNTANRAVTLVNPHETLHFYRTVDVGWADLNGTKVFSGPAGTPVGGTTDLYVQSLSVGAGIAPGVAMEIGYGVGDHSTWTWMPVDRTAAYAGENGNNDVYNYAIDTTAWAAGTYGYAVRYNANAGVNNPGATTWYYTSDGGITITP